MKQSKTKQEKKQLFAYGKHIQDVYLGFCIGYSKMCLRKKNKALGFLPMESSYIVLKTEIDNRINPNWNQNHYISPSMLYIQGICLGACIHDVTQVKTICIHSRKLRKG